jgi:hypothetical protein
VKIRIDEAGQFSFKSASPLALCVVAAVIYPDAKVAAVEKFVAEKRREWDMPRELKAGEMFDGQLLEVAEFFVDADLRLVGIISDSEIFGFEAQRAHRAAQVAEFERARAVSKTAAGDPHKSAAIERLRTRFHNPRHISMPDFFQYAVLMPWLLARALSAGTVGYRTLLPPLESWSFDIAVDPRKGADPGKAGEALRDIVAPIFATDTRTELVVPGEWPVDHPFYRQNGIGEGKRVATNRILAGGLRTPSSDQDAGLQLADYAAHVLYSLAHRGEDGALAAWRLLAPLAMRTEEGLPVKVRAAVDADQSPWKKERYRRFSRPG